MVGRSVITLLNLAIVQQKQAKFEEAINTFQKVLAKDPQNADAHFGLGFCYYRKNDTKRSVTNFLQATKFNPQLIDAYANLGAICEKKGDFVKAELFLKKALTVNQSCL